MKRRTSVFLGKDVHASVYFPIVGIAQERSLRIAHERDWSVFKILGFPHPVVQVWNAPGHEHLFATTFDGEFPAHAELHDKIEQCLHLEKWEKYTDVYGGVQIPLVTHDKFVVVPVAPEGAIDVVKGKTLIIEPPCLLWHEWHPADEGDTQIAAIITIRG